MTRVTPVLVTVLMVGVLALAAAFVQHAMVLGVRGLTLDLSGENRLYSSVMPANWGIFAHMMTGAIITALAPLQLIPGIRAKAPGLHRWSGRVLVGAALLTALGGFVYIGLRGTIGGWDMSLSFALYGALVALCAVQTARHARARRFALHRDWAIRLFFLCIASLMYRVHYGLWFLATDGAHINGDDFSGAFDLFNIWAFYVPYLLIVEAVLFWLGRGWFGAYRKELRS
ncbi:DUF2306 domain-containing protein [Roseobacteraceae bacterium S113]